MAMSRILTLALAAAAALAFTFSASADPWSPADEMQLETSPALILLADGKEIYMKKCKKCHGPDGKGKKKMKEKHNIPDFTDAKWQGKTNKAAVVKATTNGKRKKDGSKTKMKPFKKKGPDDKKGLSKEQISAVADYVKSLK